MRGDLQADPPSTDGSLDVLAHRARARGRAYVVIACRCPTGLAGAVAAEAVLAQLGRIREQQPRAGIALLAAVECDVLADGALEHPDAVLARFDMVVAAARSRVEQPVAARTRRLAAALAHPHVSVLARAGGRSIDEREPVDVDLDEVFRAAARHGKALQIDGNLTRLGLGDVEARRAAELGALFAVATDGHTDDDVETELGVALARRAWIGPDRVINCWPFDRLRAWVRASRSSCTSP